MGKKENIDNWIANMNKREIDRDITEDERDWFRRMPKWAYNNALDGLPEDARILFSRLESSMSPENLTCDGECSKSEVNRRLRSLWKQWKELEKRYKITA